MYSFEGDFRRKPQQNLAGASASRNNDRDALLLQTHQQRQKREEHRKQLNSAIKIQAYVRSYLIRKHCKENEREQFDYMFPRANPDDQEVLTTLISKFLFFYDVKKDMARLISLSQLILKQWKKVFKNRGSSIQIRRLLTLHLELLQAESDVPLGVPLRMFEVFTAINSVEGCMNYDEAINVIGVTLLYLIKRGYYKDLGQILIKRTPPLYGPSPNPPTPICGALLDLIQRPLNLISIVNIPEYEDTVMTEFIATFLCNQYTEPVELFVIPALAHDTNKRFPFHSLVKVLRQEHKFLSGALVNDSWLLHSVLTLEPQGLANELVKLNLKLSHNTFILNYLKVICELTVNVCMKQTVYEYEEPVSNNQEQTSENDDDDSDNETEPNPMSVREQQLITRCIEMLNEPDRCILMTCANTTENDLSHEFLDSMSRICHNLLLSHKVALHKYRVLYTLAFKPIFLRSLWMWLSNLSYESTFGGSSLPLITALSRGIGAETSVEGVQRLLAPLATFCSLFTLLIGTLHDSEFFMSSTSVDNDQRPPTTPSTSRPVRSSRQYAFDFSELEGLCKTLRQVCLGLVELAYPEIRPAFLIKETIVPNTTLATSSHTPAWSHLFKVCTQLVRALHERDARLHFCAAAWTTGVGAGACVGDGAQASLALARPAPRPRALLQRGLVMRSSYLNELARAAGHPPLPPPQIPLEEVPPLTIKEQRIVTILKEIPFVVPFSTRVTIFQTLLVREKHDHWYEITNFNEGPLINISVRRTHLYEDAFDKLSPENEPDLKLKLRVQLINTAGAEEPGVDGGGLFREFLSLLLKSAFDPNRGLFRLTKDNMLYPNPGVHLLYENFQRHYYFIGRMLGKALYEGVLVELPLAELFLAKLCSSREADVHALAALDPALYRGLLLLRAHPRRQVPDLGLDFTLLTDHLGERKIEELKPGGANIPVTAENRIEYIHLVADYKLNRQLRAQCVAFKRGLTSVVKGDWLRMFSCKELQLLISGAEVPIDLQDMRAHTLYGGGFTSTHQTVLNFWNVMEKFTDDQRRQLLKFVTSCSRPPLLGFKDLQPPFCIQSAGATDRLPSSSTCMNLLKLPEFPSEELLAERLLYAIQSGAGFELS